MEYCRQHTASQAFCCHNRRCLGARDVEKLTHDLKYISGVSDVPIYPDIMGLVIIDTTCEMTRIGSLHDVISVDDNVLQTIKETWIDCSVSIQKNTCVVEVITGNQ